MPFVYSADQSALDSADLTEALLHTNPEAPFDKIGETQLESLRQLFTLFQSCINKPVEPPSVERTARKPAPSRVNTHTPLRVDHEINTTAPILGTHQRPAPTLPLDRTTRYSSRENRGNKIPQENLHSRKLDRNQNNTSIFRPRSH